MLVKGPSLVNGSGTFEQDLQLTSATAHVNGTIAHGNALKHVTLCLFTSPGHTIYHVMSARPCHITCDASQAIAYTMPWPQCHTTYHAVPTRPYYTFPCPLGHNIYHAMPARPYYILCQVPCLACQAITIYHAMPARPYHTIPCDARKAIPYPMPNHTIIPCDTHQAILYSMRGMPGHTIHHARPCIIRPYHILYHARQAIPFFMPCPPGRTIYHAMSIRPHHIPCHAHQAIPHTMPCPPGHTIYHAMPARTHHIPCHASLGHNIYYYPTCYIQSNEIVLIITQPTI